MALSLLRKDIGSAFKQNLIPGLILQIFALCVSLCYFFWPESHVVFNVLSDLKGRYGWRYAAIATSVFGGILPFIYLTLIGQIRTNYVRLFFFYVIFWGIKGVEVDAFYTLQAHWFGTDLSVETIVTKTLVDQFTYSAMWAIPSIVLIYLWRDNGFSLKAWWQAVKRTALWVRHIPTAIVSNWIIWIPAIAIIYSMPPTLQLPLFNLVICFFVILLATLSQKHSQ